LFDKYASLAQELGRLPSKGDLRLKSRSDLEFPNDKTFDRFGPKTDLVSTLLRYCRTHNVYEEVVRLCDAYIARKRAVPDEPRTRDVEIGFVYLMKSGRFYKIGKTNAAGRRERELAIQLPEKATTIHVIRTDDPMGIEAYWHKRFAAKWRNGEWFDLSADDVAVFKRRKFM